MKGEGETEEEVKMRWVRSGWGLTLLDWSGQPRQLENWTSLVSVEMFVLI